MLRAAGVTVADGGMLRRTSLHMPSRSHQAVWIAAASYTMIYQTVYGVNASERDSHWAGNVKGPSTGHPVVCMPVRGISRIRRREKILKRYNRDVVNSNRWIKPEERL